MHLLMCCLNKLQNSRCNDKNMIAIFTSTQNRLQVDTTSFSRLKFTSNQFHTLYTCKITTATGWQPNCSLLLLLLLTQFQSQNFIKICVLMRIKKGGVKIYNPLTISSSICYSFHWRRSSKSYVPSKCLEQVYFIQKKEALTRYNI